MSNALPHHLVSRLGELKYKKETDDFLFEITRNGATLYLKNKEKKTFLFIPISVIKKIRVSSTFYHDGHYHFPPTSDDVKIFLSNLIEEAKDYYDKLNAKEFEENETRKKHEEELVALALKREADKRKN